MAQPICVGKRVLIAGATAADPNNEVRPFKVSACEVTNAEFYAYETAVLKQRPGFYRGPFGPDQPVADVTVNEAQAYCAAQLDEQGKPGRLLRVEEWKKMARGPDGNYGMGNWAAKCGENVQCATTSSAIVGSYPANGFGVFDVVGNIWELVQAVDGATRICGGAWTNTSDDLGTFYIIAYPFFDHSFNVGFRCAWR